VNENEYGATCAAREVFEETGYFPTGLSEEDSFNLVHIRFFFILFFFHQKFILWLSVLYILI